MKLAYLANIRFPSERAHSIQIAHMCQAFSAEQIDVYLFVSKRLGKQVNSSDFLDSSTTFAVKKLWHGFFFPYWRPAFYVSETIFTLSFILTRKIKEFDIIFSRSEWILWLLSLFVSADKLVWESHEARMSWPARKIVQKGIRIVVISKGIYEEYLGQGVTTEKMLIADDGIDSSFFEVCESKAVARGRLGIKEDSFVIMYAGGLEKWKGAELLMQASTNMENTSVVIIGGSLSETKAFAAIYPKVQFLGPQPYSELKNNQQVADILVIPNSAKNPVSSRYTSPLKLFAHMASGVPLVVSDVESLISITGREDISVFTADDCEALVEELRMIRNSYEDKKQKAINLKKTAMGYTWQNRAKKILNFINNHA